jgi:hypothetical protein
MLRLPMTEAGYWWSGIMIWISRIVGTLVSALVAAGTPAPEAAAQQIFTNDRLLAEARSAGRSNDWVEAFGYLMAYVQRDPGEMAVPEYRRRILDALSAARYNARVAVVSTGGGEAAGITGKGDSPGAGGGIARTYRRFDVPSPPNRPPAYRVPDDPPTYRSKTLPRMGPR